MIYGHLPREFGIDQVDNSTIPDLAAWLQEREILMDHFKQQLKKAQDRTKTQADRHHTDRSFKAGNDVLLKLQPFIQTSVARRPFQKVAFRYYGPYTIQEKVGAVAYRLDLPETSKIHPVVHVSLLKLAVGATVQVNAELPPPDYVLQAPHSPNQVMECKLIRSQGETKLRTLVRWSDLPAALATWEDPKQLQQQFLSTPPWGQGGPQGGENVTTDRVGSNCNKETDGAGPPIREDSQREDGNALTVGPDE